MQELQYAETSLSSDFAQKIISFLKFSPFTKAAFLFGSKARGDDNYLSDTDIALWVDKNTDLKQLSTALSRRFHQGKVKIFALPRKNSISIFSEDLEKIDILLAQDLNDLNRDFLGSVIPQNRLDKVILFDKTDTLTGHLSKINKPEFKYLDNLTTTALIDYFIFNFENCSKHHAKSDGYKFYFNYNIALHSLIQLQYLTAGINDFVYSPKNFITRVWASDEVEDLYNLKGTLFLPEANAKKRLLLTQFYKMLEKAAPEQLEGYQDFCESVFERDYFWNFRDYNKHISHLPKSILFRSASLSLFPTDKAQEILNKNQITTIIDLRAPQEIEAIPYPASTLQDKTYIKAPFDPWHQPAWFQEKHNSGTNREIAYSFFAIGCQSSFQKVIQGIIDSEGATMIHCHAGKDRTGLLIGAIQLLLGVDRAKVEKDYLASHIDTDLEVFKILFEQIKRTGSIEAFFRYQGIDNAMQALLIKKLTDR